MSEVLSFAGNIVGAEAHRSNKRALKRAAREAQIEAFRDEETQRREARQFMGLQAAAMAEAGGGSGGSNELLIKQSAALAELDALNIRYGGLKRGRELRHAAKQEGRLATQGYLMAGAELLSIFEPKPKGT